MSLRKALTEFHGIWWKAEDGLITFFVVESQGLFDLKEQYTFSGTFQKFIH